MHTHIKALFLPLLIFIGGIAHFATACARTTPKTPISNELPKDGKALFEQHCAKCHGADGAKKRFKASNLRESVLTDEQSLDIIQNGKGSMPGWEKKLTLEEMNLVVAYLKTLKNTQ